MTSPSTELQKLLDSEQAADVLGCTSRQIRLLVARGVLPAFRMPQGRALRFRPESLRRLIEDNETTSK